MPPPNGLPDRRRIALPIENRIIVQDWVRDAEYISGIADSELRQLKRGALDNITLETTARLFNFVWLGIVTTSAGSKIWS